MVFKGIKGKCKDEGIKLCLWGETRGNELKM